MENPIIVALDFPCAEQALALVSRLDSRHCRVKIGKELFTTAGPDVVRRVVDLGFDVFLDLKFHDIPNTVAGACRAAAKLGVWMTNVHASGGPAMLQAAREALEVSSTPPLLVAVTVLTSLDDKALRSIGISVPANEQVLRLARLTHECALQGVVCSPQEITTLRGELPREFVLVTPGIRPIDSSGDDQARTTTPNEALRLGASYLVIGRPITAARDPLLALQAIRDSLVSAATRAP